MKHTNINKNGRETFPGSTLYVLFWDALQNNRESRFKKVD
jgi:hypothetical protein